jgi:hypothetical protein
VTQKSGGQDYISAALQKVFLKKQIGAICCAAKHVKQNRQYDPNFHL